MIASLEGWGSERYSFSLEVAARVDLLGRPLRRMGKACPFQFMCNTMRERGSERDIQPPIAPFLGFTL